MLGTDKSRGYCLEMICADFLAGAHLDTGNPEILLSSISRYYRFLPSPQKQQFLSQIAQNASTGNANPAAACRTYTSITLTYRSQSGGAVEQNLITLCAVCHSRQHAEPEELPL